MEKEVNFSFGDGTDLRGSCGVTFKNEHFIFGGSDARQVYKRWWILNYHKIEKGYK